MHASETGAWLARSPPCVTSRVRDAQGTPQQTGLTLSSGLGKYSDIYFLSLRPSGDAIQAKPVRRITPRGALASSSDVRSQTELRKSVTAWFYDDGELAQDVFKSDVLRLLQTFERGRAKSE